MIKPFEESGIELSITLIRAKIAEIAYQLGMIAKIIGDRERGGGE